MSTPRVLFVMFETPPTHSGSRFVVLKYIRTESADYKPDGIGDAFDKLYDALWGMGDNKRGHGRRRLHSHPLGNLPNLHSVWY